YVEAKQTGRLETLRADGGLGLIYIAEDALTGFKVAVPGLGQGQAAGAAVEQLDAQMSLQGIDMLGRHGRRHALVTRCSRQAAGAGGPYKNAHAGNAVEHFSSYCGY